MIAIIDYGLGNVLAFVNLYNRLNIPVAVAKSSADLTYATHLILPGVGSFDHAMEQLNASSMRDRLEQLVIEQRIPVLGICVGMQMLAKRSDEGRLDGLGWIDGAVRKFDLNKLPRGTTLPHMGWNDVAPQSECGLFKGLEQNARFYFLHSYHFDCAQEVNVLARTDYGFPFHCAIRQDNVYGVQFHPEKSHHFGVQLLRNFAEV